MMNQRKKKNVLDEKNTNLFPLVIAPIRYEEKENLKSIVEKHDPNETIKNRITN